MGVTRWAGLTSLLIVLGCNEKRNDRSGPPTVQPAAPASTSARDGARPPKPTAVAKIPTPELPKLAAQVVHLTPAPHQGPTDDFACGTVWTGEEEIPLDCKLNGNPQQLGAPATPLIPYDVWRPAKATLPPTVDHRLDGFEGRTLNQGKAGTCTAFSLASQINHAIGLWTGTPGDVSPMQLWARYHTGGGAPRANLGLSVASESDWPYDVQRVRAWGRCKTAKCLSDEDQRTFDGLEDKAVAVLEQVEQLPEDDTLFDVIEAKIAAGRDVGTGGHLPKPFKPAGTPGSKYIPDFAEPGKGVHAFSLVGYTHVDGERYFLLKNSWGPKWGDDGYVWIHEQSLRKMIHSAFVVVVDPVAGPRRRQRSNAAAVMCREGQAPDSVDGACAPRCEGGGPRHDGYCGTTEDCAPGLVNVEGYCVLAAPTAQGTVSSSGIGYSCTPTGCIYTVPKAVAACATDTCQKSCPAPDFRLATGKRGLLCLE